MGERIITSIHAYIHTCTYSCKLQIHFIVRGQYIRPAGEREKKREKERGVVKFVLVFLQVRREGYT
jgi:hypothetical protein